MSRGPVGALAARGGRARDRQWNITTFGQPQTRYDFYVRKAAEAAQHAAATADPSMRASWEQIAESWRALAKQTARTAKI